MFIVVVRESGQWVSYGPPFGTRDDALPLLKLAEKRGYFAEIAANSHESETVEWPADPDELPFDTERPVVSLAIPPLTARSAWRHAWRRARQAVIDDEPPEIADAYAWCAWLMAWARGADRRTITPADSRPWRLP